MRKTVLCHSSITLLVKVKNSFLGNLYSVSMLILYPVLVYDNPYSVPMHLIYISYEWVFFNLNDSVTLETGLYLGVGGWVWGWRLGDCERDASDLSVMSKWVICEYSFV